MSLLEEALLLQRAAHDLMYLGMDVLSIAMTCLVVTAKSIA